MRSGVSTSSGVESSAQSIPSSIGLGSTVEFFPPQPENRQETASRGQAPNDSGANATTPTPFLNRPEAEALGKGFCGETAQVSVDAAAGAEMRVGTVKWFNDGKGFGFLYAEEDGRDVFVHHSVIEGAGYRTLEDGERVTYESVTCEKGTRATRVCRSPEATAAQANRLRVPTPAPGARQWAAR